MGVGNAADPFQRLFGVDLAHGRCVAIVLPTTQVQDQDDAGLAQVARAADRLPAAEREAARLLSASRRPGFIGGRLALHGAIADLGDPASAIPTGDRGQPVLPLGITGSISHKSSLAVALAARSGDASFHVGIDLEELPRNAARVDIAARVLTPGERAAIAHLDEIERRRQTVTAFTIKESIYKASGPVLQRMVGFFEVALALPVVLVEPRDLPAAGAEIPVDILEHPHAGDTRLRVSSRIVCFGPWILATSRVYAHAS